MVKIVGIALMLLALGMGVIVFLIGRDTSNSYMRIFSPQPHPSTLSMPTRIIFHVPADPTDRSWKKKYDWVWLATLTIAGGVFTLIIAGTGWTMILSEPNQGLDERIT